MRVIGEIKAVDLSKKLTLEITLGEIALLMAVLGETTYGDAEKAVDESDEIGAKNRRKIRKMDPRTLYEEMVSILREEGGTD